jgi:hypothetical protein
MAWKGVHLTQPARLSLADGQLCVKQERARFASRWKTWRGL